MTQAAAYSPMVTPTLAANAIAGPSLNPTIAASAIAGPSQNPRTVQGPIFSQGSVLGPTRVLQQQHQHPVQGVQSPFQNPAMSQDIAPQQMGMGFMPGMFQALPNYNFFRSLGLCLRNPCEFGAQCRNVHAPLGKENILINKNHINNDCFCRGVTTRVSDERICCSITPEQWREEKQPKIDFISNFNFIYKGNQTLALSQSFNVNKNNNNDFYDYFYDQFISIINNSIREVSKNGNMNQEVLKEVIHEVENIYYKNCLKLENKNAVKITSDEFIIYSVNSRSLNNKKCSVEEIFEVKQVDFGIISEVNTKKPPKIKGFHRFNCLSDKKFHGTVMYVKNKHKGTVAKIPDEQFEDEIVHVIVKSTTPVLNIIGVYIEIERDKEKVDRVWRQLTVKLNNIIERGESFALVGDMNRPLDNGRKSYGTKLLESWLINEDVTLLNDLRVPTRYDPVTGKGSVLDLGIVSGNISCNVKTVRTQLWELATNS